jgi:hypothetical protein
MKKTIAPAVALALGLSSFAAFANPISHSLKINASVQAGCTTTPPTGTTGFTVSGTSSTFATAVTGTTTAPANGTLTFGTLACTTNGVRVSLASARMGLYVDGTEGNSLSKRMNYVATAKLNAATLVTLDTNQGITPSPGQATLGTGSNAITVAITFPHTGTALLPQGALVAGIYSDTITIAIDGVAI